MITRDHQGRAIRLTPERRAHILEHPEMTEQFDRIRETLESPILVVETPHDTTVHVYHRHYTRTPVTSKYLLVVVKFQPDDAFVLTAFFSGRTKKGTAIWQI